MNARVSHPSFPLWRSAPSPLYRLFNGSVPSRLPDRRIRSFWAFHPFQCAILGAATIVTGHAATIFSSGSPIEHTPNATYGTSDRSRGIIRSAPFLLETLATIRAMTFEGAYSPSSTPIATDSFRVVFFDNRYVLGPNPLPNAVLGASDLTVQVRVDTGYDRIGSDIYRYAANLVTPIMLPPGDYSVSLANDTAGDDDDSWSWVALDGLGLPTGYNQGGLQESGPDYELGVSFAFVFTLEDTVIIPETNPGLLVTAGTVLWLARRRRASFRTDAAS